ncbi:MAG: aromatic ring-hydroxylating dioxygenase subunit alpha [Alphaproteobacteria bacterium]
MADDSAPRSLEGTAYGRPRAHPNELLTSVGPGTPCGEFMRRYWQPVLTSASVTNRPKEVRILGEDLIVFRDKSGRPGLLYPRCMHRGTTLFYGRVEERGIRCCYHGWLFDVEGNCLEQPCEPNGGTVIGRAAARQPWYPVQEKYGIVWAYLGPPDKMPVMRRFDVFEDLEPGETLWVNDESLASTGDYGTPVADHSWLHMNDNIMDPFHLQVLHATHSVAHFAPEFALMPKVEFSYTDQGVIYSARRKLDDGREVDRVSTYILPSFMFVPNNRLEDTSKNKEFACGVTVPVDDTHCRTFAMFRTRKPEACARPLKLGGKSWREMTPEERQDFPTDYEAQVGQGPISLHSEEHLATSDRGVAMQRRLLEREIRKVMEGGDPVGVVFNEQEALLKIPSGNFYRERA